MRPRGALLASIDGFGQVFDCGGCGNVHLQVGPVSLTLAPDAYMQLVAMVSTSAANFELWLHQRNLERTESNHQNAQSDLTQE
jgi:hypothetical protein